MAHITKIKAGQSSKPAEAKAPASKPAKATEPKPKAVKKQPAKKKDQKQPFILARPFIALGHYLAGSWREIRQVRWPSRKATWSMFFAVLLYAALFIVIITLLDIFFEWIFSLILA